MFIIDTEYTTWPGALESGWSEPGQIREIVQIGAILVDDDFNEITAFEALVRPEINPKLSELFVDLTGITQGMVDERGVSFRKAFHDFMQFTYDGAEPFIVMNMDEKVFEENCKLNPLLTGLPTGWHRLRPFLEASGVDLTNVSSGDLHKLTDRPLEGHTHNALHDVRSMACWLAYAKREGIFKSLDQLPREAPEIDPRATTRT